MNETRIILSLDPEDRARIDRGLDLLAKATDTASGVGLAACTFLGEILKGKLATTADAPTEKPQEAPSEPKKQEPTAKPTEAPAPAERPQEAKPTPDRKTVKSAAVTKIRAGHRDEVKALITGYGVEKIDLVPEDKLAELLEKLEGL